MKGSLIISLNDPRKNEYNQTLYMAKDLFAKKDDDIISLEDFVYWCKAFARAYGWSEKLIEDAFRIY